ncbi:PadR family transcriptional regulator [Streptomyces sp. NPDC046862]|uniref:PadR family transcriptional regulator n=1 Tax=Streptomyces sp. NPDC046862 TaxID=3154603 RepID=UPI00345565AE
MKLEHVLLRLLAARPYSGYDLRKWLSAEGQFVSSRIHHSQVYRALARMQDSGWVAFRVDPREHRPDAKVYRLTDTGRAALLEWIRSPYEPTSRFADPDFTNRFLATVSLDRRAAIRLVNTELDYRGQQIRRNRHRNRTIVFDDPVPGLDPVRHQAGADLVHRWGADSVDRWVAWLEDVRRWLEDDDPAPEAFENPGDPEDPNTPEEQA